MMEKTTGYLIKIGFFAFGVAFLVTEGPGIYSNIFGEV